MTVAELIEKLNRVKPGLAVKVWDTRHECFSDRFYIQEASYDDELLVTPADEPRPQPPPPEWHPFFDDPSRDRPSPNA